MNLRRVLPWLALAVVTVVIITAAPSLTLGQMDLGVTLLAYLAIAQAWNVLAGFSGQVSLGSAAFVATGGYAAAVVLIHTNVSYPVGLVAAAACSGALALLLSVPLLRLRGDYFAVGTLAVSIAVQALLNNWVWAGGASGVTLPVGRVPSGGNLFQTAVVVCASSMALAIFVKRSAFGLRLTAIRDNEPAAAGLGVSVYQHRLIAFLASSMIIGLAGAVVAYQFVAISPSGIANVSWSLNAVLMAIVGGSGTVLGPVVGVAIVYYGLTKQLENTQTLSEVLEGVLLIVIVRFAPQGVWPLLVGLVTKLLPGSPEPTPGTSPAAAPAPAGQRATGGTPDFFDRFDVSDSEFTRRVTIVTGGATGIGRATSELLRSRGGEVLIVSPAGVQLDSAVMDLGVEAVAGDASDPVVAQAAVAAAIGTWGRIDALVGCAGIGAFGSVASATDDDWDQVLTANLRSAIAMARAAMPHLVEARGAIVLVSSLAGVLAVPQSATYTVSKHALLGLVRSLATDFGPSGVRTNAVCPGPVRTAMFDHVMDLAADRLGIDRDAAYERASALNPRRSVADPQEIAEVIAFLTSPRSGAVNGAVLMADGGVSASDLSMAALT